MTTYTVPSLRHNINTTWKKNGEDISACIWKIDDNMGWEQSFVDERDNSHACCLEVDSSFPPCLIGGRQVSHT